MRERRPYQRPLRVFRCRLRESCRHRSVRGACRHRAGARSLPRHRRRLSRAARRRGAADVRRRHLGVALRACRKVARAGRARRHAIARACPTCRRSRKRASAMSTCASGWASLRLPARRPESSTRLNQALNAILREPQTSCLDGSPGPRSRRRHSRRFRSRHARRLREMGRNGARSNCASGINRADPAQNVACPVLRTYDDADLRLLVLSVGTQVGQNVLRTLAGRRENLELVATSSVWNEPALFDFDAVYLVPPTAADPDGLRALPARHHRAGADRPRHSVPRR